MKCVVKDCPNHSHEGVMHGEFCMPCWHMLTTGKIGPGETFVHKLKEENEHLECAQDDLMRSEN